MINHYIIPFASRNNFYTNIVYYGIDAMCWSKRWNLSLTQLNDWSITGAWRNLIRSCMDQDFGCVFIMQKASCLLYLYIIRWYKNNHNRSIVRDGNNHNRSVVNKPRVTMKICFCLMNVSNCTCIQLWLFAPIMMMLYVIFQSC